MDLTLQGVFFLIAVVLFVVAAIMLRLTAPAALVALGLAFAFTVFCWNAFAAA